MKIVSIFSSVINYVLKKRSIVIHLFSKRRRYSLRTSASVLLLILYIAGFYDYLFEIDYETHFDYPLQVHDLMSIVKLQVKGKNRTLKPINEYNFRFVIENEDKCRNKDSGAFENIRLLIIVKSAIKHIDRRNAIRNSWGFETRFSDVRVKRIFIVGSCENVVFDGFSNRERRNCQDIIDDEVSKNNDIVQADFVDTYYNNTIKLMTGMKWTTIHCPTAQFILLVDDDYYVSLKNVLAFIRNPFSYGDYTSHFKLNPFQIPEKLPGDYDGRLYAGYVFNNAKPHRYKFSKWLVTLNEYPYSRFPPYVTAGAIVLSQSALREMYHTSLYTQHFRFDDIYVGILAKRINLPPYHCAHFYFWKKQYSKESFNYVIASHGYENSKEMTAAWEEQRSLGFA